MGTTSQAVNTQGSVPELSVVILCYRAGELARTVVARMQQSLASTNVSYELILVGNYDEARADTDTTPAVVRDIASKDARIRALTDIKRGMFGWDVRSGLNAATGDIIAFIDGDAQNPVEDVVRLYAAMREKNADMAQTYRVTRHDGARRIMISRIFNRMSRLLFPAITIMDINSKPKLFTRAALSKLQLTSDDWFIDAEIAIQATRCGFTIVQLPTVFLKNEHRSSFVKLTTLLEFVYHLAKYRITGHV